ncbi:MAG: Bro-N domain-containing protein [Methylacidiphilales bacterium]|nr:Bro-N domain-containing protein [Candidatus Methylacidiphilales bacterium]
MIDGLNVTHKVRVVSIDGKPWFVAADVCRVLGLTNTTASLYHLAQDEKGISSIETLGGMQRLRIISEPGLYRLIMRSDKPIARPFQDWVNREVLPAIHETGGYMLAGETARRSARGRRSSCR